MGGDVLHVIEKAGGKKNPSTNDTKNANDEGVDAHRSNGKRVAGRRRNTSDALELDKSQAFVDSYVLTGAEEALNISDDDRCV